MSGDTKGNKTEDTTVDEGTQLTSQQEFDKAFDEEPGQGGGPADGDTGKTGEDTVVDDKGGKTEAPAGGNTDTVVDKKDEELSEVAKLRQEFAAEQQRTKSWEGRLSASDRENRGLKEERDRLAAKVAELEKQVQTGGSTAVEVDAELKELQKQYPDFAPKMWGVIERSLKKAREEVESTVNKRVEEIVGKRLKPIETQVSSASIEEHFRRIKAVHPDNDELVASKAMQEWIASKPAYLRPRLLGILQKGTAEESIELLTDFKAERDAKAAKDAEAKAAADKAAEEKRRKQKQDAGAVTGRSGGVPAGAKDPNDFDAAWGEAPEK